MKLFFLEKRNLLQKKTNLEKEKNQFSINAFPREKGCVSCQRENLKTNYNIG